MADLTAERRRKLPAKDFLRPDHGFPVNDPEHARLAISGAARSYNAGNISKSTEEDLQAQARARLAKMLAHGHGR